MVIEQYELRCLCWNELIFFIDGPVKVKGIVIDGIRPGVNFEKSSSPAYHVKLKL